MALHLVRWNYSPHTALNKGDTVSAWYEQQHPDKDSAVTHYISLLRSGVTGINVEVYRLVKLNPQKN